MRAAYSWHCMWCDRADGTLTDTDHLVRAVHAELLVDRRLLCAQHFDVFVEMLKEHKIECTKVRQIRIPMAAQLAALSNAPIPSNTESLRLQELFAEKISGANNSMLSEAILPHLSKEEADDFFKRKEQLFRAKAQSALKPLPGLNELVAAARKAGVQIACVSNAPRDNAELMLRSIRFDIDPKHLILGDECSEPKPSPVPYQV